MRAAELAREASAPLLIPMELKEQTLDMQGDPAVTFTGDRRWSAEALLNVMKNCMEHHAPGRAGDGGAGRPTPSTPKSP